MLARGPRVALLAYPGAVAFDLVVAHEVFAVDHSERFGSWYQTRVCGPRPGRVEIGDGFSVMATHGYDEAERCDLVVVPGWTNDEPAPYELVLALRRAHLRGSRVMSICTGAFLLGWAGLLDGRRVTTHWAETDRLARAFPRATVEPRALFLDEGRVLTSAGMTAGIDLALHVVRSDYGAEVAAALARRLVVASYRTGTPAGLDQPIAPTGTEESMVDLLDWMREHLHEPLSLSTLASRIHVSPRTLSRRFQELTGTTPHQWLIRERVIAVQRLLEATNEPIERIARRTGFTSTTNMRQLFRRQVGSAPHSYRLAHRARQQGGRCAC